METEAKCPVPRRADDEMRIRETVEWTVYNMFGDMGGEVLNYRHRQGRTVADSLTRLLAWHYWRTGQWPYSDAVQTVLARVLLAGLGKRCRL